MYLSITIFKPSWRQVFTAVQRLTGTLALGVLLHRPRRRVQAEVTCTAAELAAGHRTRALHPSSSSRLTGSGKPGRLSPHPGSMLEYLQLRSFRTPVEVPVSLASVRV